MGPYTASAIDMLEFFERQRDWSHETFGPPSFKGPKGPLDHLKKEAGEAWDAFDEAFGNPTKFDAAKVEIIDCLFLVFDAAHRAGMSYADISRIAMEKLRKNKARMWPDWRGTDPDKAIEHDRTVPT